MARSRETKIELTAYDDLFQTDESREEAKLSKIRDIPISEIDEFPDHPFKVLMDEDMEQLVESIKRNGVMTPATVRLKEDGRYELISGHRRKKACELAGLETLKCEVKELTRDEAIIVMVESNLQRSVILPSEKAFAYKMRLEAMKRQAGRPPKENASPLATNLSKGRSDEELGELVGESKDQIRRYIRLTELVPEILQMVDERQIAFRPAVEVSYLTEEQQYTLLEAMEYNDATPSLAQAIKMKKYNQDSMVELYSVQRYLQYDTLAQNGLQHFDSWASTFGETVTALELAPEGTNYRAKTRFAKFYNLPELMQMFREVADIQTADMLKLPVPKVNYHNIKTKPSEIQTEMVASLAKRAEKVRARLVEPNIDNMLKITNDGRKLALDQRMIDPMLPDDPDSKVNACVDNVYCIWEEHADTKAAQLVFCDLSTPKNDGTFNVYDDMREKLIARGIPAEQIRFIHEATTDAQKKELFGKVRSGEVRVLFGSTPKMGAGTNVQDRLIAIHNLDCPWRPSDLEQRQGRIERQGNMFPEVEVYRYVTEQTFDAYLYQLVESKQKFISQIMTSKSPVRSAEDVDEVALSFAEVKMLATGDARFKEKMDLDIQVSKLRVLKQSYLSEHYDLEDRVLKYYPQTIKEYEERIAGYENDAALAEQHKPQGEDKFCPMTLKGVTYTEKADAGEMLLAICKDYPMSAPTEIGSYRDFRMEIYYDTVNAHYCMNLCGKAKHKVDLGADALGNLTRIENELSKLPARLEAAKTKKAETIAQLETAKEEIKKPFAFEDELKEKTERLNALNIELNLNEKDTSVMDTEPEQTEEQPERKCASRER